MGGHEELQGARQDIPCGGKPPVPISRVLESSKGWRVDFSSADIKASGRVPPDLMGT